MREIKGKDIDGDSSDILVMGVVTSVSLSSRIDESSAINCAKAAVESDYD